MSLLELVSEPWAITELGYEAVLSAAVRRLDIRHLKASYVATDPEGRLLLLGSSSEDDDELDVRDNGVAVIPVRGYMTRRSYWRGDRASYEWIGGQVQAALERGDVQRIVLEVDSGGGQVNGVEELSQLIFDARGQKPITAVVLGQAASAAYYIASAAGQVLAGRSSMLGSIGTIWSFFDWSKADAEMGLEQIDIISSQSPDKRLDPKTAHGRDRIQVTVDQLAGVFVADVARNRGTTEAAVISDYGRGWVLVGQEAVDAGLADRIGTFEAAITDSADVETGEGGSTPAASGQQEQSMQINVSDITAAWLEEHCPAAVLALREGLFAQSDIDSAVQAARAEASTAATEAATAAATAERERILGIQGAAAGMNRDELVAELIADPTITVEAAEARLFRAERAQSQATLDALKGDEDKLKPPSAGGQNEADAAKLAADIKAANDYAVSVAQR